jgi:hypothetical protein
MKLGFLPACMPERSLEEIAAWAALVAGRAELEVGTDLGRDDRWGVGERGGGRLRLRLRFRGTAPLRLAVPLALAVGVTVAAVRLRAVVTSVLKSSSI